jgi:hypothetical protein
MTDQAVGIGQGCPESSFMAKKMLIDATHPEETRVAVEQVRGF